MISGHIPLRARIKSERDSFTEFRRLVLNRQKLLLLAVFCWCLLLSIGATLRAQEQEALPVLRVGVLPVLNTLPIHVAQAKGYFEEAGVKVELFPVGSAADLRLALFSDALDGIQADLVTALVMNSGGVDLRVVRHNQMVETHFAALVISPWSDIESVADLAGAHIGISENTVIHYLTNQMLTSAGMSAEQVQYEDVENVLSRLYILVRGRLDAATLPQPHIKMAVDAGGRVLLFDSAVDYVPEAVSFRADVLTEKGKAVRAFLHAYERAVNVINDMNGDATVFRELMYLEESTRSTLSAQMPPELFFSLAVSAPQFLTASVPSEDDYDSVHDWALEIGVIENTQAYEDVVDGRFLPVVRDVE